MNEEDIKSEQRSGTYANELDPDPESDAELVWISDIVEPIGNSAAYLAQKKGLVLHRNINDDTPPVFVVERSVREEIYNLVDNGMRYTPVEGLVGIESGVIENSKGETTVEVLVWDTGTGLGNDERRAVWEQGFRGKAAAASGVPGSGMGLDISRASIVSAGGTIEARSPLPNKLDLRDEGDAKHDQLGTVFCIWFAIEGSLIIFCPELLRSSSRNPAHTSPPPPAPSPPRQSPPPTPSSSTGILPPSPAHTRQSTASPPPASPPPSARRATPPTTARASAVALSPPSRDTNVASPRSHASKNGYLLAFCSASLSTRSLFAIDLTTAVVTSLPSASALDSACSTASASGRAAPPPCTSSLLTVCDRRRARDAPIASGKSPAPYMWSVPRCPHALTVLSLATRWRARKRAREGAVEQRRAKRARRTASASCACRPKWVEASEAPQGSDSPEDQRPEDNMRK